MRLTVPALRKKVPLGMRSRVPLWFRNWIKGLLPARGLPAGESLVHPLSLPEGEDEPGLFRYLSEFRFEGEQYDDLEDYLKGHFRRCLLALALAPRGTGKLLEVGAYPYYLSLLLRRFTAYELFFTNYFGKEASGRSAHTLVNARSGERVTFEFDFVNIERSPFPKGLGDFDLVLFCEVLEHLAEDPLKALLAIRAAMKPRGHLVLTTPNVGRLENVAKLVSGLNLYDPYSRYGPCGRHNREYNRYELERLLRQAGFSVRTLFSSDVHENRWSEFADPEDLWPLVGARRRDLGQYLFVLAQNTGPANPGKPKWLYRSYPPEEYAPASD